jgi:hypothetical protein
MHNCLTCQFNPAPVKKATYFIFRLPKAGSSLTLPFLFRTYIKINTYNMLSNNMLSKFPIVKYSLPLVAMAMITWFARACAAPEPQARVNTDSVAANIQLYTHDGTKS